jgi:hypothetical protein
MCPLMPLILFANRLILSHFLSKESTSFHRNQYYSEQEKDFHFRISYHHSLYHIAITRDPDCPVVVFGRLNKLVLNLNKNAGTSMETESSIDFFS